MKLSFFVQKIKNQGFKKNLFWLAIILIPGGEVLLILIPFFRKKPDLTISDIKPDSQKLKISA